MKVTRLIVIFILSLAILSCKKNNTTGDTNVYARILTNVSYGADHLQNMDVYLPPGRTTSSTKVFIIIHGGAWTSGDKSDFTQYVDTFRLRFPDYAVFNINYRLSAAPANIFPTQENDVKAAVQFIFDNASQYLISNEFILMGASAGAHLAMLEAYKYSAPVKAKAVVSFFGPSDLLDLYKHPVGNSQLLSLTLAQAIGKTPAEDSAIYISSSPVTFINSTSAVPTILLHGGTDPLVSASQSIEVKDKLTSAGVANQYIFYPAGGHGGWDKATYFDAFNKIEAFIKANVN